jgi:protein TonB
MSSRTNTLKWLPYLWFTAALTLHAGLLAAILQTQNDSAIATAAAAGTSGIEIELGMEGSYEDRKATEAAKQLPATEAPTTPPALEKAVAPDAVAPTRKPKPSKPIIKTLPVNPLPDTTTAKAVTPTEKATTSADGKEAKTESAMIKATGTGNSQRAGGIAGSEKNYFNELKRWLDKHKDYPTAAKQQKQEGTVMVRFTINRAGEISSASIKRSAGYALLDQAAFDLLKKASPVPPMPDSITKDTLSIAIPIEYALLTK